MTAIATPRGSPMLVVAGAPPNTSALVSRALLVPLANFAGDNFTISREFRHWLEGADEHLRWWLERNTGNGDRAGESALPSADRLATTAAELLALHLYIVEARWPTPLDFSSLFVSESVSGEAISVPTLVDLVDAVTLQYATDVLQSALALIRNLRRDAKHQSNRSGPAPNAVGSLCMEEFVVAAPAMKLAYQRALAAYRTADVLDEALTLRRTSGYRTHPRVAHGLGARCRSVKAVALAVASSAHLSFALMSTGRAQLRPQQLATLAAGVARYCASAAEAALDSSHDATLPDAGQLSLVSRWHVGLSSFYRAKDTHQVPRGEIPDMSLAIGLATQAAKLLRPAAEGSAGAAADIVRQRCVGLFPLLEYIEDQVSEYLRVLERENELVYQADVKPETVSIPSLDVKDELPEFATKEDAASESLRRLFALVRHRLDAPLHSQSLATEDHNVIAGLLTNLLKCAPSHEAFVEASRRLQEPKANGVSAAAPPPLTNSAVAEVLPPAAKVGGRLKQLLSKEKRPREESP